MSQTSTPWKVQSLPSKDTLLREFQGKQLETLRTPAMVIDRAVFAKNCARMHDTVNELGIAFRAHLKSHKTAEGARLQLNSSSGQTNAVVVSTLMEAWNVLQTGLVADETVLDMLYGMPVSANKLADLSTLWDDMVKASEKATLHILVDHLDQLDAVEQFEASKENPRRWTVFVKVDAGYKRAGLVPGSEIFQQIVSRVFKSQFLTLHGFYCHAGDSYSSKSLHEASGFLSSEIQTVNAAAKIACDILKAHTSQHTQTWSPVLSVGSTPTAHAASTASLAAALKSLHGRLELHAGNYPLLDLQQVSTSLADIERISHRILATVVSYYPGRGPNGEDEAMCDAGAIATSKDTGPIGGYGKVEGKSWTLSKVSQEHGILRRAPLSKDAVQIGEQVRIIGQHACLIAAAHSWYYIVDSSEGAGGTVVDVWVPWKGW